MLYYIMDHIGTEAKWKSKNCIEKSGYIVRFKKVKFRLEAQTVYLLLFALASASD